MDAAKKRIVKKRILVCILLLLLLLIADGSWHFYRKYAIGTVGKTIMQEIDSCADENGDCTIALGKLTDFEWDTLVVFDEIFSVYYGGYSSDGGDLANQKMSEILGFTYERTQGYRAHFIFVKDGALVHDESYLADIEVPSKINVCISSSSEYACRSMTNCCVLSADSADIAASCDGEHYYLYF